MANLSSFWDPQSGAAYLQLDLKLVHFWFKTTKTRLLRQNIGKQIDEARAIAQAESNKNLSHTTDNRQTMLLKAINEYGASHNNGTVP